MRQRRASAHTIASYRDTFQLLLQFVHERLRKAPSVLMLEDIDAPLVAAFLDELEAKRGITARTRNLRLTAVHSFFRYVAFEAPANAAQTQRVLAIPAKRFTRTLVPFLSRPEVDALLAAPDQRAWSGRRDHALILLAVQTGLRLSELTNLMPADLQLGAGANVHVIGKGRKERCTPVSKSTRAVLTAWLREPPKMAGQPVFPNAQGGTSERAWCALPAGQARGNGGDDLPVVEEQAREPARAAPHDGDGSSAGRRGSICDRALARPRVDRDNSDVSGR